MAVHTVRLKLDDEIPEHALILARLAPLSGLALAEFLRLHFARSVLDVEKRSPSTRKAIDGLQAGIETRRARRKKEKPAGSAADPVEKPSRPAPFRPFNLDQQR